MIALDLQGVQMAGRQAADLQNLYLSTGNLVHLEAAIAVSRVDLAGSDPSDPDRQLHLSRLSNALRMRFEELGNDRDLHEAIEAGRRCVRSTPSGHRSEALRVSNLGYALRLRYERMGAAVDIREAVRHGERAVAVAREDDPTIPQIMSNYAVALRVRYEVTHDPGDLARSIDLGTRCLREAETDSYEIRGMLSNLGLAYFETFEVTGRRNDLVKSAELLRQALARTPDDDPDRPKYALNLSVAMRAVATELHSREAADDAVTWAEHARDLLPEGHLDQAGCLSDLGRAHRLRADLLGDPAQGRLAVSYRRLAATNPTASPVTRALAARAWGEWSRADGDLAEAVKGYAVAIELLSLVAWHGLDTRVRERQLRRWRNLAEAAAAVCIEAEETGLAVTLLEQGRTVLWNQLLDQRADFTALRSRHAKLADRLDRIRLALDAGGDRETRAS